MKSSKGAPPLQIVERASTRAMVVAKHKLPLTSPPLPSPCELRTKGFGSSSLSQVVQEAPGLVHGLGEAREPSSASVFEPDMDAGGPSPTESSSKPVVIASGDSKA